MDEVHGLAAGVHRLQARGAIIYAAAFSQFETNDDKSMMGQLYGVALLILAAVTLPALMRFVAPVVEQGGSLGGSGGGARAWPHGRHRRIALKTAEPQRPRGAPPRAAAALDVSGGGSSPSGGATAGGRGRPVRWRCAQKPSEALRLRREARPAGRLAGLRAEERPRLRPPVPPARLRCNGDGPGPQVPPSSAPSGSGSRRPAGHRGRSTSPHHTTDASLERPRGSK